MKLNFIPSYIFKLPVRIWLFITLSLILLASCNITRNVPEGKYLLNRTTIKVTSEDVNGSDLETYLRQKPNKRIIGFRFHLRVYNTANPYKFKGIHRLLKTIGEEPVVLDTFLTAEGENNIKLYLQSKGYYQSAVHDTILYNGSKADVIITVDPKTPYKIRNLNYVIEDTLLQKLVLADTVNSLIKKRKRFDRDILQEERTRLQAYLQNCGYYFFNKEYITLTADTSVGNHRVDLLLNIKNRFRLLESGSKETLNFLKYKINNVYFYPNYDPRIMMGSQRRKDIDSVSFNNVLYIFSKDPGINLKSVDHANLIQPGSTYSDELVQKTQDNLNSLRLFRMVNIFFNEVPTDTTKKIKNDDFLFFADTIKKDTIPTGLLNCYIQLSPHTLQSYQTEVVGTNTSGALGAEGNFTYQHKNLFRGAEIFDIKLRGLVETVQKTKSLSNLDFKYSLELGGSVGINIPRFLSPFAGKEFIRKYSPRTQFTASYNFQNRPDYTRTIASLLFGYNWKNSKYLTHNINPAEVNLINLTKISESFKNQISGKYIENSYKNQIITVTSYNLLYNNQNLQKNTSYSYLRFNVESSGNVLATIYSKYGAKSADSTYQIFKTSFSQFVRSDFDLRYHQVVDNNNTFVYRIYAGVGYPYGNSKALPFDKKYFSGGANGIRAWSARSLGPGTLKPDSTTYFNQVGDIKLEANIEYRFKIFWQLEGALFFDAGNIWSFPGLDNRKGAEFKPENFYKQIALGTGTGFRMNLGFLTLRFDFGYRVFDPVKDPEKDYRPWVPFQQKFVWKDDFTINFGIGYPF